MTGEVEEASTISVFCLSFPPGGIRGSEGSLLQLSPARPPPCLRGQIRQGFCGLSKKPSEWFFPKGTRHPQQVLWQPTLPCTASCLDSHFRMLQELGLSALLVYNRNSMFNECSLNEEIHETQGPPEWTLFHFVLCSENRQMTRVGIYLLSPRDQPEAMHGPGKHTTWEVSLEADAVGNGCEHW